MSMYFKLTLFLIVLEITSYAIVLKFTSRCCNDDNDSRPLNISTQLQFANVKCVISLKSLSIEAYESFTSSNLTIINIFSWQSLTNSLNIILLIGNFQSIYFIVLQDDATLTMLLPDGVRQRFDIVGLFITTFASLRAAASVIML